MTFLKFVKFKKVTTLKADLKKNICLWYSVVWKRKKEKNESTNNNKSNWVKRMV